jgi:hypothetical protein
MNILAFVLALLMIFSIITTSMLKNHKDSVILKKSIKGFYNANNLSQNSFENFIYKGMKAKKNISKKVVTSKINTPTKNTPPKQKKKKEENEIYDCARINVLPLLENGKNSEKELYNIMIKLLKNTYFKNSKEKNIASIFLNNLIKSSKKSLKEKIKTSQTKISQTKEITLEKITFENENFQRIWYQMLKGSKFFDPEKNIGYPSILEFISITSHNKICLHKAKKELLLSLFNENTAKKIIFLRNEDKKNLKNLITKEKLNSKNWNLVDFSHKNHSKCARFVICTDEESKISIKKNLNFQ